MSTWDGVNEPTTESNDELILDLKCKVDEVNKDLKNLYGALYSLVCYKNRFSVNNTENDVDKLKQRLSRELDFAWSRMINMNNAFSLAENFHKMNYDVNNVLMKIKCAQREYYTTLNSLNIVKSIEQQITDLEGWP